MFVPVADSVSGSVLTGLRKCYISLHRIIPTQTALVGDEFRSTAGRRPGWITSIRSFISFNGWKFRSWFSSSWPFLHTDVSTEWHRRIWPMNFSSPRISGSELSYDRRWSHHCLSAVRGCRLSTTELFLSPLPAPGTTCHPRHARIISVLFL